MQSVSPAHSDVLGWQSHPQHMSLYWGGDGRRAPWKAQTALVGW